MTTARGELSRRAERLAVLLSRHPQPFHVDGHPVCYGCRESLRIDRSARTAYFAHVAEVLDQFITDEITAREARTVPRGNM